VRPLALLLATFLVWLWTPDVAWRPVWGDERPDAGTASSVLVETQAVRRQALSDTLTGYGRLQPDPDSTVSVNLAREGLVARLWVRLGQLVAPGAALLELDTAPGEAMKYEQAQAAVQYARGEASRMQRLFSQQLATRDQVDAARRALQDAEAALAAQRKLGAGQAREVVRAPFAGIVTDLAVRQGQRVQAGADALILAPQENLLVTLGVEPEDARRAAVGMPVLLTPVFEDDVKITSRVANVHAMVNPSTRLVDILVKIPPADTGGLVVGMTLKGVIEVATRRVLAVPRAAVLRDARGSYLFIVQGGRARRIAVRPGLEQGEQVAVEGPLKEGDRVVVLGNYELQDGMRVREASR
jgi:membrane fusion protein (multidrug efflux system)